VAVGAFRDDDVKRVIGMREGEEPLDIMPVGSRRYTVFRMCHLLEVTGGFEFISCVLVGEGGAG